MQRSEEPRLRRPEKLRDIVAQQIALAFYLHQLVHLGLHDGREFLDAVSEVFVVGMELVGGCRQFLERKLEVLGIWATFFRHRVPFRLPTDPDSRAACGKPRSCRLSWW